ncbi:Uncharacterized protein FKW44_003544, partial [Caligus rogercresseyi]
MGGNDKANFCVLGTRIVRQVNNCTKEPGSDLFDQWCKLNESLAMNETFSPNVGDYTCDEYFNKNDAFMKRGIRGLWNGTFYDNVVSNYKDVGDAISSSNDEFEYNLGGAPRKGYITSDIYTSFVILAGKGLTIGVTVLEGHFGKMYGEAQAAKFSIQQVIKEEGVKGFADVVVSKDISDGVCHLTQTTGLGGMKPNTVILGWPNSWRKKEEDSWKVFVDSVRYASAAKMALLVPKGIQRYPDSGDKQHRTWKNCKLRIFSVAQPEDNSIQMKKDLKTFLYHLRIEADVEVVEMLDSDISEYTYERTLLMEQRNEMLKEMRVSDKRKGKMVVDDVIIHADKVTNDLEVENIVKSHVETVIENSRADPPVESKIPPKVKFSEEIDDIEEDKELEGNSLSLPSHP